MPPTDQSSERDNCVDAILKSEAKKKLIVAGPGTGKSYTFKQLFSVVPGNNVALTFIRALAKGTGEAVAGVGRSYTFHGYCKHLLHQLKPDGITPNFSYYPNLIVLQADDVARLARPGVAPSEIEHALYRLDDSDGLISLALRSGDAYDAVGHVDSVYRALSHLERFPEDTPRVDQLVVDEYQDFSLLEVSFIDRLAERNSVLIVGDDDQALYSFRCASPDFIRQLARDSGFQAFELPFCTRCTEVLVAATHTVVTQAQKLGLLEGRLEKRYECFTEKKGPDSDAYPNIIHARCSVEASPSPYAARYIERRLGAVSNEDIAASRDAGEPTALIIGPSQFLRSIRNYLTERGWNVSFKDDPPVPVRAVDGVRLLLHDVTSPLAWRILTFVEPPELLTETLSRFIVSREASLFDLVPEKFRSRWLRVVEFTRSLMAGEAIDSDSIGELQAALGMTLSELKVALEIDYDALESDVPDEGSGMDPEQGLNGSDRATVTMTSLVGAKGLQAAHVFIVGVNEGHFPKSKTPTNDEVSQLLVALTRAQKSCTLVSCVKFHGQTVGYSVFLKWLEPHLSQQVYIDKVYLDGGGL